MVLSRIVIIIGAFKGMIYLSSGLNRTILEWFTSPSLFVVLSGKKPRNRNLRDLSPFFVFRRTNRYMVDRDAIYRSPEGGPILWNLTENPDGRKQEQYCPASLRISVFARIVETYVQCSPHPFK